MSRRGFTVMATKGSVGKAQTHDSAELHVRGAATYTDDIPEPAGCLHAYILKSPLAHAKNKPSV